MSSSFRTGMRIAERARRVPLRRDVPVMPLLELEPDVPLIPLELLAPLEFDRLRSTSPPDVPVVLPLCALVPFDGMHVVDAVVPPEELVLPMPELEPLPLFALVLPLVLPFAVASGPMPFAVLLIPAAAPPPVPLAPFVVFNPLKVLLGFVPVAPLTPLAALPLTPLVLPTLVLVLLVVPPLP